MEKTVAKGRWEGREEGGVLGGATLFQESTAAIIQHPVVQESQHSSMAATTHVQYIPFL
jgi:hypothetical protein